MNGIIEKITEFIKELLTGWITSNLDTMFTDVNTKVGTIAAEVGRTPQDWNSGIFSMIKSLSDNVIVPIAGMIITFVLCYELISMIMEKNNMHDTDTFMFFKYIFKMWVAVYLVTHTFDIAMAIFDVANHVVTSAGGIINGNASIDVADALQETIVKGFESLHTLRRPEFFKTWMMRILINTCLQIRKQRQRLLTFGDDLPEIPVEDSYDSDFGFKELLNMVGEEDRLLLTLYYADEFKVSEIAELLEMNVNTVKTRLSRAREKIRRGLYE